MANNAMNAKKNIAVLIVLVTLQKNVIKKDRKF